MKNKFILIIFFINTLITCTIHSMNSVNSPKPVKRAKHTKQTNIYLKDSNEQQNKETSSSEQTNHKSRKITISLSPGRSSAPHSPHNKPIKQERPRSQSLSQINPLRASNPLSNFVKKASSDSSLSASPHEKGDNETLLIQTIRGKNFSSRNAEHIEKVKAMLENENIDVNHQNRWGNTALHYANILHLPEVAILLLRNPRTITTIRNDDHSLAEAFIQEESPTIKELKTEKTITVSELKKEFFARTTLDVVVNEESFNVLVMERITRERLYDLKDNDKLAPLLDPILETIKARIKKDNENQEHYQEIPNECRLPQYATDDFIKQMIFTLLYYNSI